MRTSRATAGSTQPRRPRSRRASGRSTSTSPASARTGAPAPPSTDSGGRELDGHAPPRAPTRALVARSCSRSPARMLGPQGLTERAHGVLRPRARHGLGRGARARALRPTGSAGSPIASRDARASSESARTPQPGRPARYSTSELIATRAGRARARRARARRRRARRSRPRSSRHVLPSAARCPVARAGGDAARGRRQPRPRRLRRRARRGGQDDRRPALSPTRSARPASPSSAQRPRASPPRSSRTRPASPRRRSTGCSIRPELPDGCVVVVDEAGMAETRVLAPLLERVEQARRQGCADRRPAPASRGRSRRALRRASSSATAPSS